MSRPSTHTDLKLIKAARQLFPKTGCSRLKLHVVAKKAHVNMGMFHYNFKSKDIFVRKVLQDFYEDFFSNFDITVPSQTDELENLRTILLKVGYFVRENQGFMTALISDLMNEEPVAYQFVKENFFRHFSVLFELVSKCQKRGLVEKMPPEQIISFIMPAVLCPIFIAGRIKMSAAIQKNMPDIVSEKAIQRRVDFVIRGIRKEKHA